MYRKILSSKFITSNLKVNQMATYSNKQWNIQPTDFASRTINPLRIYWERNKAIPNKDKYVINLQPGDPTLTGHFPAHPIVKKSLEEALEKEKFSYLNGAGDKNARQSVAEYSKHMGDLTADDVILTTGCSMAFEIALRCLANPGENVLVPRPSWNYETWIYGSGINAKFYDLDPDNDWEIKLDMLESLIDEKTRAIICNSPSNPCGSVFSKQHMLEILDLAERHCLPIISDEVYEFFTFPGVAFHSFAELSKNVPILVLSGLTKRFVIPSVRLDWVIIADRGNKLQNIRKGFSNVAGRNFYPNSTVQFALPRILKEIPQAYHDANNAKVYKNALMLYENLKNVDGIKPIMSKGAMYMLQGIELDKFKDISTCYEFSQRLIEEESLLIFPGECFNFPGYFRIVLATSEENIKETAHRIAEFCKRHRK